LQETLKVRQRQARFIHRPQHFPTQRLVGKLFGSLWDGKAQKTFRPVQSLQRRLQVNRWHRRWDDVHFPFVQHPPKLPQPLGKTLHPLRKGSKVAGKQKESAVKGMVKVKGGFFGVPADGFPIQHGIFQLRQQRFSVGIVVSRQATIKPFQFADETLDRGDMLLNGFRAHSSQSVIVVVDAARRRKHGVIFP